MNFGGDITMCVVPSREGVFSRRPTCLAAMHCTRSLANERGRCTGKVAAAAGAEWGLRSDPSPKLLRRELVR